MTNYFPIHFNGLSPEFGESFEDVQSQKEWCYLIKKTFLSWITVDSSTGSFLLYFWISAPQASYSLRVHTSLPAITAYDQVTTGLL